MPAVRKRPRRFRFSLRSLLVILTVAAIGITWLAHGVRKANWEMEIVDKYRSQGPLAFEVRFAHEESQSNLFLFTPMVYLRQFTASNLFSPISHIKVSDKGAIGIFEEDIDLSEVQSVNLQYLMALDDLSLLDRCPNLKSITIEFCNVAKFEGLEKFDQLDEVCLWTNVTTVELVSQIRMHRIKHLRIQGPNMDSEDIDLLCQLENLQTLDFGDWWGLEEKHAEELRRCLPQTKISYRAEKGK